MLLLRKAFNQLDSSDTGESLAGEDIRSVDPVTSSIFLLWSVFFSTVPILHQNQLWDC